MPPFKGKVRIDPNKEQMFPHFSHTPFEIKEDTTSIAVDAKGKTKIVEEHTDEEYSEIVVPATFIYFLSKLCPIIKDRKLVISMSGEGLKLTQLNEQTEDSVKCSLDFLEQASQIIKTTRKVEMKNEPYRD
jgi:hypothetical protein